MAACSSLRSTIAIKVEGGDARFRPCPEHHLAGYVRHRTRKSWRPVAWLTSARSHAGYRRLLAAIEKRTRTGERAPGANHVRPAAGLRRMVTYLPLEDQRRVAVLEVLWAA